MFFDDPMIKARKKVAVIVAHPDDETLWAGGTILNNPGWHCFIACLCRKDDPDRAPKFEKALKSLGAEGAMGDLNDGPAQFPLKEEDVQAALLRLLPATEFDLVITHSIYGEYTRHLRHEEIGRAVIKLWHCGKLNTNELWAFAYEDGRRAYKPIIIEDAPLVFALPPNLWEKKYQIITEIYGFEKNSWEAQTTPREEAFWQFDKAEAAVDWMDNGDVIA